MSESGKLRQVIRDLNIRLTVCRYAVYVPPILPIHYANMQYIHITYTPYTIADFSLS